MFEQKISDVEFFMHSYVVLAACFVARLTRKHVLKHYRQVFSSLTETVVIYFLKVSQSQIIVFKPRFLPKNKHKNTMIPQVNLFSFVLLEESEDTKKIFRN